MTSEAVFIQVGALADGFAPHGNLLATASLPAGENFTFYVAGSEPQQLVIEDEQTLSWNGKRAPWRATALRPDILFIDFLDPERDNASISAVCNLTQRNAHAGIRPATGRSRRAAGRLQPGRTRVAADRG
ncbi:MoaF protein [Klebsiella pneumoniae]|uniref:MoaF protein n=1 Tax=Klebsiella pneumoniae TaxID=573 RepID=A0A2X1QL00_KLEPN|nr:MoaF protein [Klebsiella pneumoniae]